MYPSFSPCFENQMTMKYNQFEILMSESRSSNDILDEVEKELFTGHRITADIRYHS